MAYGIGVRRNAGGKRERYPHLPIVEEGGAEAPRGRYLGAHRLTGLIFKLRCTQAGNSKNFIGPTARKDIFLQNLNFYKLNWSITFFGDVVRQPDHNRSTRLILANRWVFVRFSNDITKKNYGQNKIACNFTDQIFRAVGPVKIFTGPTFRRSEFWPLPTLVFKFCPSNGWSLRRS